MQWVDCDQDDVRQRRGRATIGRGFEGVGRPRLKAPPPLACARVRVALRAIVGPRESPGRSTGSALLNAPWGRARYFGIALQLDKVVQKTIDRHAGCVTASVGPAARSDGLAGGTAPCRRCRTLIARVRPAGRALRLRASLSMRSLKPGWIDFGPLRPSDRTAAATPGVTPGRETREFQPFASSGRAALRGTARWTQGGPMLILRVTPRWTARAPALG
jgi:hypothetical protein